MFWDGSDFPSFPVIKRGIVESSRWAQNRAYIIGALSVFVLESALVAGLLVQRARRRRVEAALRASEARYRGVVETQTELICRCLSDTTLTFVNDAYCRFWRKRREDLIGTEFLDLIPPARRDDVRRRIAAVVESRGEMCHEHEVLLPDGSVGWQHWINHALVNAGGQIVELQATGRDITERKRAEQALRTSDEALRASYRRVEDLAGRLIAAQEAERKRIARDLHDDLSQKLALLSIDIDQIPRRTRERLGERVRDISGRAAEIASDVHRLAYELHPSKLESLGLVAALQSVCRDISRQYRPAGGLRAHPAPGRSAPGRRLVPVPRSFRRRCTTSSGTVARARRWWSCARPAICSSCTLPIRAQGSSRPLAATAASAWSACASGSTSSAGKSRSTPRRATRIGVRVSLSRTPVAPPSSSRLMLGA